MQRGVVKSGAFEWGARPCNRLPSETGTTFESVNAVILRNTILFPMETRWNTHDDTLRLEGRALMLGIRLRCRTQHARGNLHLTLCDNLAFTLALAQGRSSYARLNTTCPH